MARGWESKAVESQIEAAEDRAARASAQLVDNERMKVVRELESIELSRTRVLQDLASAVNPRYREILQRSLDFLDERIAAIQANVSKPDPHG